MQPSRRHPSGSPRAVLPTVAAALAAAVLLATATAGPALAGSRPRHASGQSHTTHKSHASQTSHKGWVKYFIVAPPKNGAKEFLFEIAADTLGQGSRSEEIFKLNKGRLQPGGGRLENPTVIEPGWILILPPDAHGPGVHFGPLPTVPPVVTSPSSSPSPSSRPTPVQHRRAATPAARPGNRMIEAGIGGALVVALLLAIGLLLMRRRKSGNKRRRRRPARPSAVPAISGGAGGGPRRPRGSAGTGRQVGPASRRRGRKARPADPGPAIPLPQVTMLSRDPASVLGEAAPDGLAGLGQPAEPGPLAAGPLATPATPSWLGPPASEDFSTETPALPRSPIPVPDLPVPDLPVPGLPVPGLPVPGLPAPAQPRVAEDPENGDIGWPDFLNSANSPADAQGQGVPPAPTAPPVPPVSPVPPVVPAPPVVSLPPDVTDAPADVPPWLAHDDSSQTTEPSQAEHEPELHQQRLETDRPDTDRPEAGFSPVALRLLGAQRSVALHAEDADVPVQRHEIGFGEDRIEIVLAEAPAATQDGTPHSDHTWLTDTPYLAWMPLPYEAPDGGTAFACLGVGDEGCLFVDLGAAPGAVALGGDRDAATRLAESIVHQLSMSPTPGQSRVVVVVGAVVPEPHPAGVLSLASLADLASVSGTGASDAIEIVLSELRSDDDAFALARYVASSRRRVVPVVLADLPDAPWSFTAQPSLQPSGALDPASA